jgi:hypothetical protein
VVVEVVVATTLTTEVEVVVLEDYCNRFLITLLVH